MNPLEEKEILAFVSAAARSLWTVELLVLLRRNAAKSWEVPQLVRELRASNDVIAASLGELETVGLATRAENGTVAYRALSPALDGLAEGAAELYRTKPVAVMSAIAMAPNEKLRIFADAFRLKE